MWKSERNGSTNKKNMKKFYELFAQPSYISISSHNPKGIIELKSSLFCEMNYIPSCPEIKTKLIIVI